MPPPLLIDLEKVDLGQVLLTREQIYEHLPHRFEFMLLSGVCHLDLDMPIVVAYMDLKPDDWWVRGHIPGGPLLPGVLMLEVAGHASALLAKLALKQDGFIGFGGVEHCKFRESVVPPSRLYILSHATDLRLRRIISETQGVADDKLIFEAQVTGMRMR